MSIYNWDYIINGYWDTKQKLLLFQGIEKYNKEKELILINNTERKVFDWFNNTIPESCGNPALNITHINIDYSTCPPKKEPIITLIH